MSRYTIRIKSFYEETLPIIILSQFSVHSNESKWKPRVDWLKMTSFFRLSSGMTRRSFMSAHSYVLRQDSGKNIIYTRTH